MNESKVAILAAAIDWATTRQNYRSVAELEKANRDFQLRIEAELGLVAENAIGAQQDAEKVDAQPFGYTIGSVEKVEVHGITWFFSAECKSNAKRQVKDSLGKSYLIPVYAPPQPDPAMAGDDWLAELAAILDRCLPTPERNLILQHARKRVQPKPAMAGEEWLTELMRLVEDYKDTEAVSGFGTKVLKGTIKLEEKTKQAVMAHALKRVQPASDDAYEALRATLEYIDAIPKGIQLPVMPGFDRDWVDATLDSHRRIQKRSGGDAK